MAHIIPDEDPCDLRLFIPNVEFYITNVCNLTCTDCNRFNNHDFRGWQRWSDYSDQYSKWAQHVRLQRITILGGEPLLNPSLLDWIDGINNLWHKPVQILTNGTRLNHVPGLYEKLLGPGPDPTCPWAPNWIGVSLHNRNDLQRCFDEIRQFLCGEIKYYDRDSEHINLGGAAHSFVDSNNVRINVWEYDSFYTSAVQKNSRGLFTLHNSDPVRAHSGCGFVMYKCYHFIRGKLYKCGPVALWPEFDQQHRFDITDEERIIMNSYQPLTVDNVESHGREFMSHIDDVIPQCRFCPVEFEQKILMAVSKKPNSVSAYD